MLNKGKEVVIITYSRVIERYFFLKKVKNSSISGWIVFNVTILKNYFF